MIDGVLLFSTFRQKLLHDAQGLVAEFNEMRIRYLVCSGRDVDELLVEKLVHVAAGGISVYPPLSSQFRGVKANIMSAGILLGGACSNVLGLMNYYVQVDRVEYATERKIIKILWQTVRGENHWEILHNMEYFSEDLKHLVECIGGRDALNYLPDFNVDIREKCKEVCRNGLIVKLAFTSGTLQSPPMVHGNSCWKLRNMGVWPTCPLEQSGSDIIDDNHALNSDFAILGDSIFQYLSFYGLGRHPV